MNQRRVFLLLVASLVLSACARPLTMAVNAEATVPFRYGPPTNIGFRLDTAAPGAGSSHTITFDIRQGDLETYQAVITYPAAFKFNGFLALGPVNSQVGSYAVDFDFNGTTDFTIPVRSIDNNTAYGDRDGNGSYGASIDSTLVYSNQAGAHVFTITLPNGGDGSSATIAGPFTERLIATVNFGVITNPVSPGTYTTNLMFTSVDPDNDGADDRAGNPPMVLKYCKEFGLSAAGNLAPSAPALVSPADGASGTPANIVLQWAKSTDPDGDPVSYRVLVWQGGAEEFTGCNPAVVTASATMPSGLGLAGVAMSFALFGMISLVGFRKNGLSVSTLILLVALVAGAAVACSGSGGSGTDIAPAGGDGAGGGSNGGAAGGGGNGGAAGGGGSGGAAGGGGSGGVPATNASFSPAGLAGGTLYSWRVVADDGKGGITQSATRRFTTQ